MTHTTAETMPVAGKKTKASLKGLSPRRRVYEVGMRALIYAAAALVVALLLFLLGYIFYMGLPNLTWEFLTSEESVLKGTEGILPAIQNTLYVIVATLVVSSPWAWGPPSTSPSTPPTAVW